MGGTDPVYMGGLNNAGISVPAGQRKLIGPFTFTAPPSGTPGFGSGHKCLLAAVRATGQPGPANTTDPLASFQVGQRNLEFSDCQLPLTNASLSDGQAELTLTASVGGAGTPDVTANTLTATFNDPAGAFFAAWQAGSGPTTYALSQLNGQTTVTLARTSVVLAPITILAGTTVTATARVTMGANQPVTTLQVQATLKDINGVALAPPNGLSCVGSPNVEPPVR
jgi:hypothetical protein